MKISQRLTRAGLTFIVLGSIAAVLPGRDGSAQATDVTTNPTVTGYKVVRLTTNADCSDSGMTATVSVPANQGGTKPTQPVFTCSSTDGNSFGHDPGILLTETNGTGSATVTTPSDGNGAATVSGVTVGTATITANFPNSPTGFTPVSIGFTVTNP